MSKLKSIRSWLAEVLEVRSRDDDRTSVLVSRIMGCAPNRDLDHVRTYSSENRANDLCKLLRLCRDRVRYWARKYDTFEAFIMAARWHMVQVESMLDELDTDGRVPVVFSIQCQGRSKMMDKLVVMYTEEERAAVESAIMLINTVVGAAHYGDSE